MTPSSGGYDGRFFVAGGTVRLGAPSYVERTADRELYEAMLAMEFAYVLDTRQMGKSSLMARTAQRLRVEHGYAVATIDLSGLGQGVTPDQWYDSQLIAIGKSLHIQDELEEFIDKYEKLGPLDRWKRAIREVVLERVATNFVIFVDEIDYVRGLPFPTDEFFAGIREFHSRRPLDPVLERLTFCLLGVATPSDLIRSTETTPFNIGRRIVLTDLSEKEHGIQVLLNGFSTDAPAAKAMLHRVLYWTGGHPYLTQKLCDEVTRRQGGELIYRQDSGGVDQACRSLFLVEGARAQNDNLAFVTKRILESASAIDAVSQYKRIRNGERVVGIGTDPWIDVLRLSGIVRLNGDRLEVRNRIYSEVFDDDWITRNLTPEEVQRQEAAARAERRRTLAFAGTVLLILALIGVVAYAWLLRNRQRDAVQRQKLAEQVATQQTELAKLEKERADTGVRERDIAKREAAVLMKQTEIAHETAMLDQQRRAELEERQSWLISRDLASKADLGRRDRTFVAKSLLLSIEALGRKSTPEAYRSLVQSMGLLARPSAGVPRIEMNINDLRGAKLSPNKRLLATYSDQGALCVYDLTQAERRHCLEEIKLSAYGIADDGSLIGREDDGKVVCAEPRAQRFSACRGARPSIRGVTIGKDVKFVAHLEGRYPSYQLVVVDVRDGSTVIAPLAYPANVSEREREDVELAELSAGGDFIRLSTESQGWIFDLAGRKVLEAGRDLSKPLALFKLPSSGQIVVLAEKGLFGTRPSQVAYFRPGLEADADAAEELANESVPWEVGALSADGRWLAYMTVRGVALVDLRPGLDYITSERIRALPVDTSTSGFRQNGPFALDSSGVVAWSAEDDRVIVTYDSLGTERGTISAADGDAIMPLAFVGGRLLVLTANGVTSWETSGPRGIEYGGETLRRGISPPISGGTRILSSIGPDVVLPGAWVQLRNRTTGADVLQRVGAQGNHLVSQDGQSLAFETPDGIVVRRLGPTQETLTFKATRLAALSANGRWVVARGVCMRKPSDIFCLRVMDTTAPAALGVEVPVDSGVALGFMTTSDGRSGLALVSRDAVLRVVDTDGREVSREPAPEAVRSESTIFSADGSTVMLRAERDGSVILWKPRDGSKQRLPMAAGETFMTAAFSSDGSRFAIATSAGLRLYQSPEWTRPTQIPRTNFSSYRVQLAFDNSGERLAITDSSVLQEFVRGALVRVPVPPSGRLELVGYSSDSQQLLVLDGRELVWVDVSNGAKRPESGRTPVVSAQLAGKGSVVITLEGHVDMPALDPSVDVFRPLDLKSHRVLRLAGTSQVTAISSIEQFVAIGDSTGTTSVYSTDREQPLQSLRGSGMVRSLAFSSDSRVLAIARDETVSVCRWRSGCDRSVSTTGYVTSMLLTAAGRRLIVATREGVLSLFDADSLKPIRHVETGISLQSIVIDPGDRVIAAVGPTGLKMYRLADWQQVGSSTFSGGRFAAFSPSGALLAVIEGKAVHLINSLGKEVATFLHDDPLKSGAFTSDGSTFAAATRGGVVLLQLPRSGLPAVEATGFIPVSGNVEAVAFTSDGRQMIVTRSDPGLEDRSFLPLSVRGLPTLVVSWLREDLIKEACSRLPKDTNYSDVGLAKYAVGGAWNDYCRHPDKISRD